MGKYERFFRVLDGIDALLAAQPDGVPCGEITRQLLGLPDADAETARFQVRANLVGDPWLVEAGGIVRRRTPAEFERLLASPVCVVLDLETTGLGKPGEIRIMELGALRLEGGIPTVEFHSLVDPGEPIAERVQRLTGITDAMVAGAPAIGPVFEKFLEFARGATLVAHNMPFDGSFLNHEMVRLSGHELEQPLLCTVRLARRLLPDLPDYHLDDLARHFGIEVRERHRSLGDVRATAAVFRALLAVRRGGPA